VQGFDDFDDHQYLVQENLEKLKRNIMEENLALMSELEKSAKAGGFSFFSSENVLELKNLLKLCGIPYVEAPFEAES
jgi:hypothetical protein